MNQLQLTELYSRIIDAGSVLDLDAPRDEVLAVRLRNAKAKKPQHQRAQTRIAQAVEVGGALRDREVRYVMSSEIPAGWFGDVVQAKSWDLQEFKQRKSPLLWLHGRDAKPPIGRMRTVRKNVEHDGQRVLAGVAQFMDEGTDEFTDGIYRVIEAGFMDAGSVGFEIKRAHAPSEEEAEQYGLDIEGEHRYAIIVDKANLVEYSVVPVGADPNAMAVRDVNDDGIELGEFLQRLVERGEVTVKGALELRLALLGADDPLDVRSADSEDVSEPAAEGGASVPKDEGAPDAEGDTDTATAEPSDAERGITEDEVDALVRAALDGAFGSAEGDTDQPDDAPEAREGADAGDTDFSDSVHLEIALASVARVLTTEFAREIRELRGEFESEIQTLRGRVAAISAALGLPTEEAE